MPITKSAKKKLRKDKKRETQNLTLKKAYKKALKKTKTTPNKKNISDTDKVLDKSAKKGIIHKNKAARLKSRLSRQANKNKKTVTKKKTSK